jgi:endonuclease YncB( thermonuclease family)
MTVPTPNYAHKASFVSITDADSFRLRLDLGTYTGVLIDPVVRIRLEGIDCWETNKVEQRERGIRAKLDCESLLTSGGQIIAQTLKTGDTMLSDTLGRQRAYVWVSGIYLPDWLRERGHEKVL